MAGALVTFFHALREAGDETFFHPHPLTDAEAALRAGYDGHDLYYVMIEAGQILGYGFLRGWDEGYEVPSLGIVIHPAVRGRGFGRSFMHMLHDEARAHGASRVRLTVHLGNVTARRLYEDLGYVLETAGDDHLVGLVELKRGSLTSELPS